MEQDGGIPDAGTHSALALLGTLAVTNRNGCDSRDDVLRRDPTGRLVKAGLARTSPSAAYDSRGGRLPPRR